MAILFPPIERDRVNIGASGSPMVIPARRAEGFG